MKPRNYILLFTLPVAFIFTRCKKQKFIENVHNHSLLTKPLIDIKREIAGKWQFIRTHSEGCGFAGCWNFDTTYKNSTGDYIYFLANDTVKRTGYADYPIKIYERAEVNKEKNYTPVLNGYTVNTDSIYIFRFSITTAYALEMLAIKNDTLVMDDGWGVNYVVRK